MVLVSSAQVTTSWTIPPDTLTWGVTYQWRIDTVNEFGTTTGDVWTFTDLVLGPPNDVITYKRLVGAANNALWFEAV